MEQPSLLLQLSSSLHQLNMGYTRGGEEKGKERPPGEDFWGGEPEKVTGGREGGRAGEEERREGEWGGF